jgi:hypothetical protein
MSEIITDKLTGKTSADEVTITQGSVEQKLKEGLIVYKAFFNQNSSTQFVASNTLGNFNLNISSGTDVATGEVKLSLTNSLDNLHSINPVGMTFHSNNLITFDDGESSTSAIQFEIHDADSSVLNDVANFFNGYGDLA